VSKAFADTFAKLYGFPCWGVKPGLFPSLTMEFGEPHLEIREPQPPKPQWSPRTREHFARRLVVVHGAWHLWVYCCDWIVFLYGRSVGDSSSRKCVQKAADALDGQALVSADVRVRGCRTVFEFDLGGRLVTRPYDRKSEQWLLYTPSGKVLNLRADKQFKFAQADGSEEARWQPLLRCLAEPAAPAEDGRRKISGMNS
jgi:hypothetical protein